MTECLDQEQQGPFDSGHSMRPFCQRIILLQSNSGARGLDPETPEPINIPEPSLHTEGRSQARADTPAERMTPGSVVLFVGRKSQG